MKTGLIDVGGGLRGVYAAGVMDRFLDEGVPFDLGIGISAGSANIASFLAGQRGRNHTFFTEYPFRREYMSLGNLLRKGSYLDLDYIYSTLSDAGGENPLDLAAIQANPAEFLIVAAEAKTGATRYFTKEDLRPNDFSPLKASSAIPFVCRPPEIGGVLYFDGALGDTIPLEKAFQMGCDKVVLILTKPRDAMRDPKKDEFLANRIRRKYPAAAQRLLGRAERYNEGVILAKDYERIGKVLIIAPDDTCGVDTLTKNRAALEKLYQKGYEDGAGVQAFLDRPVTPAGRR